MVYNSIGTKTRSLILIRMCTSMGIIIKNSDTYLAGEVFCYRSNKKIYGCVFLHCQGEYYLVALSEAIDKPLKDVSVSDILNSHLYTLAWFSDVTLLLPVRLHMKGTVDVNNDYSNCAGLLIDEKGNVILRNCGQPATWRHQFRAYALKDTTIKEVLDNRLVTKTNLH